MGRNKGVTNFSVNFEPTGRVPLDARLLVDTKTDLYSTYPEYNFYEKMIVTVADENAQYMLIDANKITTEEGWKKLDNSQFEDRIKVVENDIVDIKEDIALLQGDDGAISGVVNRISSLETNYNDLEPRVAKLEAELEGQNSKLEIRIRGNA